MQCVPVRRYGYGNSEPADHFCAENFLVQENLSHIYSTTSRYMVDFIS
ncbi:hypothetical protein T4C_3758 [Trichinella pseudospiralis]|uniref:Uncharacterized protein n=1 Tax=Trichinella pseudospiralis TaxID=6337 RepID=A0A0V1GXZ0_TRIPS|nr:hypothetical protein T4C_3758 [Trichinella pseudospiralis]